MRIGIGFDFHPLVVGRRLVLGGVEIPFDRGLEGHSDADVLTHAIGDAMLGASGQGDLGCHFPDTDPAYQNISSQEILRKILGMVRTKGYRIANVDSTIVAERPRLTPHTGKMKEVLSATLGIAAAEISIKATTMERFGSVGREEGIAALAAVLLEED
jgi:2-C-methyl-D-erythritol 2,4-cyclodiphosphate synthase